MLPFLSDHGTAFPPVETALKQPNGLLCAGGVLSPERLLSAYQQGIFPWYSAGEPVLWWSPNPRAVIYKEDIHISRSMRRTLAKHKYRISHNVAFSDVIHACAAPRNETNNTSWITAAMIAAYSKLFALGYAHSYECWYQDRLVGGIYGIKVNHVFCGESMFSRMPDASKTVLIHVAQLPEYKLIDCQIANPHLLSMGAQLIPRESFLTLLK